MDISNCIRIVHDKIQNFEPELASKIVGCILMNNGEEDVIRLASCPDQFIREAASKAIQMLSVNPTLPSTSPTMDNPLRRFSRISPRTPLFQAPSPYWDAQSVSTANPEYMATNYLDSIAELQNQAHLLSLENHPINHVNTGRAVNGYNGLGASPVNFGGNTRPSFSFSSSSEFPLKICHYFNKGYCRNGLNCKYSHAQILAESFSQMHANDAANEDQVISPGSLAQLESEIVELLKQRKGNPMSIASLPMIYHDKYKKGLRADGYLTESQRHGRTGYSLTRLLVRLPSIRLIDRPHGQHAVVLAEDAHKYIQKGDSAQHISASRQIYLTFPADSTFSEDDVADYFNTFGSVADVRIPCQQKRMFGFVTFTDAEPVKVILDKGNPHYVRGSRVLVKPYREKVKVIERKYQDRMEPSPCCSHHYDMDCELNSIVSQSSLRRQLIQEHEQAAALEFQRRRLAQLQITRRPLSTLPPIGVSMEEFRASNDHLNFQPTEPSSSAPLNGNSSTDSSNGNSNEGFNLLDSSFAFPIQSDFLSSDLVSQTHKRRNIELEQTRAKGGRFFLTDNS